MPTYAVFLRAVNVGGTRKLPMADLRATLEKLGYTGVSTYLQSGNAVVSTPVGSPGGSRDVSPGPSSDPLPGPSPDAVAAAIRAGLVAELGLDTEVFVRTAAQLAAIVAENPFPEAEATPTLLHVAFLARPPVGVTADPGAFAPDEFRLGRQELYLRYATSSGRSKLAPAAVAKLAGPATARNWNTVLALARQLA